MATPRPSRNRGLNQAHPKRLADDLARRFGRMNDVALRIIRERLVPALATGTDLEIAAALQDVQNALDDAFPDGQIRADAQRVGAQVNRRHRDLFFAGLAAVLGVRLLGTDAPGGAETPVGPRGRRRLVVRLNLEPNLLVDNFVDENLRYVSTLRAGVLEGVGDAVTRHVVLGEALEGSNLGPTPTRAELADELLATWERKGVPSAIPIRRTRRDGSPVLITLENHAALIARDQVSKLNGQLNRARQTAAGITSFVWETQDDSRVRPEHRALDGRRFTWADGAGGVYPGQPVQCRCWARPVVDRGRVLRDGAFIDIDQVIGSASGRGQPGITPRNPGPGTFL